MNAPLPVLVEKIIEQATEMCYWRGWLDDPHVHSGALDCVRKLTKLLSEYHGGEIQEYT